MTVGAARSSFPFRFDLPPQVITTFLASLRLGSICSSCQPSALTCSTRVSDFSLFKNIRGGESKTLQFRGELLNLFNRPNFRLPNNMIGSPNFG